MASLKQQLRRPNAAFRWTATTNLFVDAGTKDMDTTQKVLKTNRWSVEYFQEFIKFIKQTSKKAKATQEVDELPGKPVSEQMEAIKPFVQRFGESPGWHFVEGIGIQVVHGAASLRSPQPRFAARDFPLRTTLGEFISGGKAMWRVRA